MGADSRPSGGREGGWGVGGGRGDGGTGGRGDGGTGGRGDGGTGRGERGRGKASLKINLFPVKRPE